MTPQMIPLSEFVESNGVRPMDFLVAYMRCKAPPVMDVGGTLYVDRDDGKTWLHGLRGRAMLIEAGGIRAEGV